MSFAGAGGKNCAGGECGGTLMSFGGAVTGWGLYGGGGAKVDDVSAGGERGESMYGFFSSFLLTRRRCMGGAGEYGMY